MDSFIDVLLRWLHILPVVVMVGGALGGRFLGVPQVAVYSRGAVIAGISTLMISGLINMIRIVPTAPKGWHMWFGIKFLLALHVLSMIFLMTNPNATPEKRARWQVSALITTTIVILIAAYMRSLHNNVL